MSGHPCPAHPVPSRVLQPSLMAHLGSSVRVEPVAVELENALAGALRRYPNLRTEGFHEGRELDFLENPPGVLV